MLNNESVKSIKIDLASGNVIYDFWYNTLRSKSNTSGTLTTLAYDAFIYSKISNGGIYLYLSRNYGLVYGNFNNSTINAIKLVL